MQHRHLARKSGRHGRNRFIVFVGFIVFIGFIGRGGARAPIMSNNSGTSDMLQTLADSLPYLLWGAFRDGPPGGVALTLLLCAGSGIASAALGLAGGIGLALLKGRARTSLLLMLGFFRAIPC